MNLHVDIAMDEHHAKVRVSDDSVPQVIDGDGICAALGLHDVSVSDSDGHDDDAKDERRATRRFELGTATTLRMEFRNILKIENLEALKSLTRLFLDNNIIERLSGLDQLYNLTWLDLSFNRICRIEGLEALKRLEVLALFSNEIERIENLDHLDRLRVLRLGRNRIADKDEIIHLRRLPALKTLSIKENPFCTTDSDWEGFVIALLPGLTYLECHSVSCDRREAAMTRHQGDVFRVKNLEEGEKDEQRRTRDVADNQRQKAAFVSDLKGDVLLQALMQQHKEEEQQLRMLIRTWPDVQEKAGQLWEDFSRQIIDIGNEMQDLGLQGLQKREQEVALFEQAIARAQKGSQVKGVKEVDEFLEEKDAIFEAVFHLAAQFEDKEPEEITDLQREEVEKLRERFVGRTKELWNTIMANEITLVNQIEQVLAVFEETIEAMLNGFLDSMKELFALARAADIRYFKKLTDVGEAIEEMPYRTTTAHVSQNLSKDLRVSSIIAKCNDGHQHFLREEESKLRQAVFQWRDDYLLALRNKERKRNRNRILELNHFVDTMRQEEEEELDVLPATEYMAEDILLLEQ